MNNRNYEIKVRLTQAEMVHLTRLVGDSGLSRENYLRKLISGVVPREAPPPDFFAMMRELHYIGNNLNQIARTLNEWHSPYPAMAKELREAAADLAALKYEVLKKVGDAVGNTQAFRL